VTAFEIKKERNINALQLLHSAFHPKALNDFLLNWQVFWLNIIFYLPIPNTGAVV